MDIGPTSRLAIPMTPSAPPAPVADSRPAADAMASKKENTPQIAFGSPPQASSTEAAARANLAAATSVERPTDVQKIERALKPWGIQMLPKEVSEQEAAEAEARAAKAKADAADAKAADASESAERAVAEAKAEAQAIEAAPAAPEMPERAAPQETPDEQV